MIYALIFVFGMVLGSFGSVLLWRLQSFDMQDILGWKPTFRKAMHGICTGRSCCDNCGHTLGAIDLIPVLSYVSTGGKCRYCKIPMSIIYPLLEIGSGLVAARTMYHMWVEPATLGYALLWVFASCMLYLLIIHDMQTMYLHDSVWVIAAIATIGLVIGGPAGSGYQALIWGAIATGFFAAMYQLGKVYVSWKTGEEGEGFGLGDVWLAPIIGIQFGLLLSLYFGDNVDFIMGFQIRWEYVIIAGACGLAYAGIQRAIERYRTGKNPGFASRIPFFPGMIAALWVMMWWLA